LTIFCHTLDVNEDVKIEKIQSEYKREKMIDTSLKLFLVKLNNMRHLSTSFDRWR
jgi:hypothetical protein